jgi:adenylyltransferase/sulfurtransferase
VEAITEALVPTNARGLLNPYDLILDCTDNPATRYLLSDTAVLLGKPLISGAAQRFDGQLCTYNLGPEGPCYRCLFPKPPSTGATPTCEETGIVGAVTGVIGSLQALEAIKIIVGLQGKKTCSLAIRVRRVDERCEDGPPSMLVYSALGTPPFRSIKLRKRRASCPACGTEGQKVGKIEGIDYVQFCGGVRPDWENLGLLPGTADSRITANVGTLRASLVQK